MTVSRTELRRALNTLCKNRNDLYTEIERLNDKVLADIKEAEASFRNGSVTRDEANADIAALRTENARLLSVGTPLDEEFVVSHKKAMDGIRNNTLNPAQIARLYAEALEVFETAYAVIHPDAAKDDKTDPTKKPAPKADDKAGKDKKDDTAPKPVPAPVADKDDDKVAKDDKTTTAPKPAPKADDKAGKDDSPVTDVAGLAALIKSGQDKCDAGFTAVRAEIATVAKGTLPEDIAKAITDAGLDRVKAILDGTAPTAGLSEQEHAMVKLFTVAFDNYTSEQVIDAVRTLMAIDKFSMGLLRPLGK